jgi:signal peptidase II
MHYLVIAAAVLLDQLVKHSVRASEAALSGIPVIPGVFQIRYVRNTGAAFSLLEDHRILLSLFSLAMVLALLAFLFMKRRSGPPFLLTAVSLAAAGGISNLADRVRFGYVTDFIDFHVFPVFNIADIFVCAGCGLIVLYVAFLEPRAAKRAEGDVSDEPADESAGELVDGSAGEPTGELVDGSADEPAK